MFLTAKIGGIVKVWMSTNGKKKVDMHKKEYLDCLTTSLKATITTSVIDTHDERDTSNIDIPGEELNTYS